MDSEHRKTVATVETTLPGHSRAYLERERRLQDSMNLRKPDRVPVLPVVVHYYPNQAKGVSNREMHYDMATRCRLWRDVIVEHDWDGGVSPLPMPLARPLELLGLNQLMWPGGSLPDNRPFQFDEREYMLQDEYDEMLADPSAFSVRKLWPRISSVLGSLPIVSSESGPSLLLNSTAYHLPGLIGGALSDPAALETLQRIIDAGREVAAINAESARYVTEMVELGYPFPFGAIALTAFDCISDFLRGLRGTVLDMYQVPDKLLAAIDMFVPWTIEQAVSMARMNGSQGVYVTLHRGAAGFMSNEQFARFYWPSLKALLLGLVEAGLTPMPLFEGDFTPRLEFLQELPPGKVVGHFDKVDRRKAKDLLGDVMCFWGNIPSSLMCTATPREVKDDVRELIETFGDNGGLIIDGTVGIPDEARPENVFALREAVNEWGVY